MQNEYHTSAAEWMFALLSAEICDRQLTEDAKTKLTPELIGKITALSHRHDLAQIVGHALGKLGMLGEDESSQKLRQICAWAVLRNIRINYEYERVCQALEQARIPYIPLKGSVIRPLYPEPWMRTSCDIDILVKEEILEEATEVLVETLSYTRGSKKDHEITLYSDNGVHLELHYETIQSRHAINSCRNVLARIWQDALLKHGQEYLHCMSDAMFYFYHIAHMAKHFREGGCGVRPFLDLWLLNHKVEFDKLERETLLDEGGLLKFALAMEEVSEFWFSGRPESFASRQISNYILHAGTYGNTENKIAVAQAQTGGRFRYFISKRVFIPFDYLRLSYPVLDKHKWLFPLYQVVRWINLVFNGGLRRAACELKLNKVITPEKTMETADMLKYLGL